MTEEILRLFREILCSSSDANFDDSLFAADNVLWLLFRGGNEGWGAGLRFWQIPLTLNVVFGQYLVSIWSIFGQNLVNIWSEFGQNLAALLTILDQYLTNMTNI